MSLAKATLGPNRIFSFNLYAPRNNHGTGCGVVNFFIKFCTVGKRDFIHAGGLERGYISDYFLQITSGFTIDEFSDLIE
jgi:hypothetical protein